MYVLKRIKCLRDIYSNLDEKIFTKDRIYFLFGTDYLMSIYCDDGSLTKVDNDWVEDNFISYYEKEELKSLIANFLNDLKFFGEINKGAYDRILNFSMELVDNMYKLRESENSKK